MKTIEGNKLIAEFMGLELADKKYPSDGYWISLHLPMFTDSDMTEWADTRNGMIRIPRSQLKYHSSWDWLMPVVEKIESLGYNTQIHFDLFMVGDKDSLRNVTETSASPKIMSIWYGVIAFIEWYNEQSKEG